MGPWMHAGWDGWATMLAWHTLGWVVVLAAATAVVAIVVRPRRSEASPRSGAADILAGRYARGEIDTDEYHLRLEALR